MKRFKGDALLALALGLAALILYISTSAPSVATLFDDSLEFQVVIPTLGIAHPSGYPLYTLAGKAATLLIPFGDAAGRLNLLSAIVAAAAVSGLFLVARRFAGSRAAAVTAAAVFALSPTWWSQATLAEVYALHGLFVVLFLYCLLRWEEGRLKAGRHGPAPSDRWLWAAALICGLGLAHHRMIALLVPAALVFILWTDPALLRQPRRWLMPLLLGLAPLVLYLYLPLRGQFVSSLDGQYQPTLRGTLDWITARGYSVFLTGNPFDVHRRWTDYLAIFYHEVGGLSLVLALLGLSTAFGFLGRRAVLLLLATVAQIAFGAAYKVEDVNVFLIPAFMFVCIWAAMGLAPMFDRMAHGGAHAHWALQLPGRLRVPLLFAWLLPIAAVVLIEPVRGAIQEWPQRNRSDDWEVYDTGRRMVEAAAPDARIVGLGGEATLVRYFRDVLGARADLQVTRADPEPERYAAIEAALARGEPVYLTRDLPGAAQRYSLDAAGPLILVSTKAQPETAPAGEQSIGPLTLLSASLSPLPVHGRAARITLRWTAAAAVTKELKVSARLLDSSGQVVAGEDAIPVHFTYPTTAWVPGESVDDCYDLRLPASAPEGQYSGLVILYRSNDGRELGRATLGPLTLP